MMQLPRFTNLIYLARWQITSNVLNCLESRVMMCRVNYKKPFLHVGVSCFHTTEKTSFNKEFKDLAPSTKELAPRDQFFREIRSKNKHTFLKLMEIYDTEDKNKRGHVEFIYAALKYMSDFGVEGDLDSYKKLMNVFPKGKMIPKNLIQSEFYHFPRHQDCAINLLDVMEHCGVCPDREMGEIIKASFGRSTHVFKKYCRMMYWMPKLKNINPYLLPNPVPDDARELAQLALKKMSVDPRTKILHYDATTLDECTDKTWIVSAQSIVQKRYIHSHPAEEALYVEGPFLVWLSKVSMTYFVLRADPKVYPFQEEDDADDVSDLKMFMFGDKKPKELVLRPQSVHEQEEGIIMAMCCTGTSSKNSLLSWIHFLRETNPALDNIPVLFKLKSSPTSLVAINAFKSQPESEDVAS